MITCSFNFNLNILSKHNGMKAGWGGMYIEIGSRLGWNFFARVRHWDKDHHDLLPPVTKFRFRTVEYYNEVEKKTWNFMDRKYDYHWAFCDEVQKERNEHTRLIQVIYRLPLITITNSYHTKLDEQRHDEFMKDIDKPLNS